MKQINGNFEEIGVSRQKIRTFTWKFFELREISVANKRVVGGFFSKINSHGATLIRYLRVISEWNKRNFEKS